MMSVEVFDPILKLSARSFVKFFDYVGTSRFGPPVMRFHVFNKLETPGIRQEYPDKI
jgi:hypothetical protein